MQDKVSASLRLIEKALASAKSPITLWSGGKDSQVLLWLVRQVDASLPVFFFREPFQESKFAFNHRIVREWGLKVFSVPPAAAQIVGKGEFLEIINLLKVGPDAAFYLPTGINQTESPTRDWACGVQVANKPTTPETLWRWDCAFIGQRNDDVDPVQGAIPLAEYSAQLGNVTLHYPLRDWTEADIWAASAQFGIPQNFDRYDAANGYKEKADRSSNPDYMNICAACLIPGASATVLCPHLDQHVPRIGNNLCTDQAAAHWRNTFINLEAQANG